MLKKSKIKIKYIRFEFNNQIILIKWIFLKNKIKIKSDLTNFKVEISKKFESKIK